MYLCPLCQQPLQLQQNQYRCSASHSFDIAREGYVNLLPVQHKGSKDPGDNKAMMLARRQFLQAGWYKPLSDRLNELALSLSPATILDLGCGEGYYSGRLAAVLPNSSLCGIDISKAAIRYAAKSYPQQQFAVASAYQLPFADDSFELILRVYAPSQPAELKRVIRSGGYLLTVTPAPHHLVEMKHVLYPQVRLHPETITDIEGFSHQQRQQLSYPLHFTQQQDLDNLIQMVPLAWKFTPEIRQRLFEQSPAISIDFYIDLYQET